MNHPISAPQTGGRVVLPSSLASMRSREHYITRLIGRYYDRFGDGPTAALLERLDNARQRQTERIAEAQAALDRATAALAATKAVI